ncbi:hypothetical protein FACS189474_0620 [Bacteroidia bacterium]|nr:hypothetical protein FACS189474_0620 [Bacteroidia bacterium]
MFAEQTREQEEKQVTERLLGDINLSVDKVLDIAKTMLLTPRHKSIDTLFDENFWKSI